MTGCSLNQPEGSGYYPKTLNFNGGSYPVFLVENCRAEYKGSAVPRQGLSHVAVKSPDNRFMEESDLEQAQLYYSAQGKGKDKVPTLIMIPPMQVMIEMMSNHFLIQELYQRKVGMFNPVLWEDRVFEHLFLSQIKQVNYPDASWGRHIAKGIRSVGIPVLFYRSEEIFSAGKIPSALADLTLGVHAPVFQLTGKGGNLIYTIDVSRRVKQERPGYERIYFVRPLPENIENIGDLEQNSQYLLRRANLEMETAIIMQLLNCWGKI